MTAYRNGLRALETLRGSALYDAVLVSSRLHDVSGVDLITRIRALDHRKDVPIVMVTGTVSVEVVTAALAAGADDVLCKPVDVSILVATVSKCAERRVALFTSDSGPRPTDTSGAAARTAVAPLSSLVSMSSRTAREGSEARTIAAATAARSSCSSPS